jgi:hypothetical protein
MTTSNGKLAARCPSSSRNWGKLTLIYFTAAFGENFNSYILPGLVRSFERYNPGRLLVVFSDQPERVRRISKDIEIRPFDLPALLDRFNQGFYNRANSHRRDIFKLALFLRLFERTPRETLCWIDADSLVFDKLDRHFRDGQINVVSHGSKDHEVLDLGNGLKVSGDRFAIGGVYSLPCVDFVEEAISLANERVFWSDPGTYWADDGDQIVLNHLIARHQGEVNFASKNPSCILNLSYHQGQHPFPGDPLLSQITLRHDKVLLGHRQMVIMLWTQKTITAHLKDDFLSFEGEFRELLKEMYGGHVGHWPRFASLRFHIRRWIKRSINRQKSKSWSNRGSDSLR